MGRVAAAAAHGGLATAIAIAVENASTTTIATVTREEILWLIGVRCEVLTVIARCVVVACG